VEHLYRHNMADSRRAKDAAARASRPYFENLHDIRFELRQRRKSFLGSSQSLCEIVCVDGQVDDGRVSKLSTFLAARCLSFWSKKDDRAARFCFQFFYLAICSIAGGNVGDESIDDIIQLAEALVRSREVFCIVVKELVPADMVGEMFDLTESYDDSFYTSTFEDAVLGAVSVYLGMLKDPIEQSDNGTDEET